MLFPIVPATLFFMIKRTQPEVGSLVVDRRKRLRMDASELAVLADVDPKTLRSLERGDRWPREATRLKIEHALHWRVGALDSLRAGGAAFAVDGLAAIDPAGDELFYPDPEMPDVHENSAQTVAAQQVLSQLAEIGDALDRQPDTTSARADGRIRSAIKLQESAIDALIRSDRQQAIGDLDTSIVVLQSTISILNNKENGNDLTTESTTASGAGEADPDQKKDAGRPRNGLNLIPGGQVAEVDDAPPADALADAARTEIDHLTTGKRTELEQAISTMSTEELRSAAAEDPLLAAYVQANYPRLSEGWGEF
ncbi:immunity repressor [Gordonia phage Cashline]|nr:immunity repressor [Gordonia phage Cashline]